MSELYTYFYFILPDGLKLEGMKDVFSAFCRTVARDGFSLVDYTIDWESENGLWIAKPVEIDAYVAREVDETVEAEGTYVDFRFLLRSDPAREIRFSLDTTHRLTLISVDYSYFTNENDLAAFVGFSRTFYSTFPPLYGCGPLDILDIPDVPSIAEGKIETLYAYNFLGPDLVATYGLATLHTVPARKIEDLPDGGMFIAMELNPLGDWRKATPHYEEAIRLLGISRFQQGA